MSTPAERLQAILNKDGTTFPRKGQLPKNAFAEVLDELRKERTEASKGVVKELLVKALTLEEQGRNIDKEYKKSKQKFEKELGGVLKQIENLLSGHEQVDQEENKEVSEVKEDNS